MASVAMSRSAASPLNVAVSRSERHRVAWWYVPGALMAFAIAEHGGGTAGLALAGCLDPPRRRGDPCRASTPVPVGRCVITVATQTSTAPKLQRRRRRWLGLRRAPGRLALGVFRMPLLLYRRGWGWLLGRSFLLLTHVGRKTGQAHATVAMVLADDHDTGEVVICSAWGPDADWVLNLRAHPAREVRVGRDRYAPMHRFLTEDEAVAVGVAFREEHPWRLRLLSTILGWGDLTHDVAVRDIVRSHPFVALGPAHQAADQIEER
jgi:deazaflavin-dependent oxidoreductase (nitroreductase family)